MNDCQFVADHGPWRCLECGHRLRKPFRRPPPRNCRPGLAIPQPGRRGRKRRFGKAAWRWIKAGGPTRPLEEVARIYDTLCRPCPDFDADRLECSLCGCRLSRGGKALRNKIVMATEHCRKDRW